MREKGTVGRRGYVDRDSEGESMGCTSQTKPRVVGTMVMRCYFKVLVKDLP